MSKRFKNRIILSSILSAVSLAVVFSVWLIVGGRITTLADSILSSRTNVSNANQEGMLLAKLKQESVTASTYRDKLTSKLVTKENLLNFSDEVNLLGKSDNVNVGFRFGDPGTRDANGLNSVGFVITASGNYNAIVKFVSDLEGGQFYVSLNNINIVSQSAGDNVTLNGQIYFYDNGK